MALNIAWSISASLSGTGTNIGGGGGAQQAQVGTGGIGDVVSIGTSSTALPVGGATITAGGAFLVVNQDPTNYVEIDCVNTFNSGAQQKLFPGCGTFIWPEAATWYLKANTAACNCLIVAFTK